MLQIYILLACMRMCSCFIGRYQESCNDTLLLYSKSLSVTTLQRYPQNMLAGCLHYTATKVLTTSKGIHSNTIHMRMLDRLTVRRPSKGSHPASKLFTSFWSEDNIPKNAFKQNSKYVFLCLLVVVCKECSAIQQPQQCGLRQAKVQCQILTAGSVQHMERTHATQNCSSNSQCYESWNNPSARLQCFKQLPKTPDTVFLSESP